MKVIPVKEMSYAEKLVHMEESRASYKSMVPDFVKEHLGQTAVTAERETFS